MSEGAIIDEVIKNDLEKSTGKVEETKALWKQGQEISAKFPDSERVQKEYKELRQSIINSLRELRCETGDDLENIKAEIQENCENQEKWEITEAELEGIQKEFDDLEAKAYEEDTGEEEGFLEKVIRNTDSFLDIRKLKKEHWDSFIEDGYTKTHLHGYNKAEWGNFAISIEEFESIINTSHPSTWNSLAFANYIKMLSHNGKLNSPGDYKEKIGLKNIVLLQDIWSAGASETFNIARNILAQNPQLSEIIEGIETIEDYSWIISNTSDVRNICEGILLAKNIDEEKKDLFKGKIKDFLLQYTWILNGEWKGNIDDTNPIYKEILHEIRIEETKNVIIARMWEKYKQYPSILSQIETTISEAIISNEAEEQNFFLRISRMIRDANKNYESDIPLLSLDEASSLQSLLDLDSDFDEAIQKLKDANSTTQDTQNRIDELKRTLEEKTELSQIEREVIQNEIMGLQRKLWGDSMQEARLQEQVSIIEDVSKQLYELVSSPEFNGDNFLELLSKQENSEQFQSYVAQIITDITENWENSIISNNLGEIALSSLQEDSPIYNAVKKAKVQEFQTELNEKVKNSPEIQEMKQDMIQSLTLKYWENIPQEDFETVFSSVMRVISENPEKVDSLSALAQVFDENTDLWNTMLGLWETALNEMQSLIESHRQQLEAAKMNTAMQTLQEYCNSEPRNEEGIIIVYEAISQIWKKIDELRANQEYLDEVGKLWSESLEYRLLTGDIENYDAYLQEKQNLQTQSNVNENWEDVSEESVNSEDTVETTKNEETNQEAESIEEQTTAAAQAIIDAETPEEQQAAAANAENVVKTLEGEAQIEASATVMEVLIDVDWPEATQLKERVANDMGKALRDPLLAKSEYAQTQVNNLLKLLWENDPIVQKISAAQEEGIQKAYNTNEKTATTIANTPPHVREFYAKTLSQISIDNPSIIESISLTELKSFRNNPEAIENFLNAYDYFNEAGLPSVWEYRHEIQAAMRMENIIINANLEDDSLKEVELLNFAQYVERIIYGKNVTEINNINVVKANLQWYNSTDTNSSDFAMNFTSPIRKDKSILYGDSFATDLNSLGLNGEMSRPNFAQWLHTLANSSDGLIGQRHEKRN
jgi:hypothetical protein